MRWDVIETPQTYHINDMYVDEMRYFLDCISQNQKPMSNFSEAAKVTRAAFVVKQSLNSGEKVTLDSIFS